MKKLIVGIAALFLLGVMSTSVQSAVFTGCISPGGDLKNVAEGEEPLKPCGKNDTMTQWEEPEEPEPASECPCDIGAAAGWAGWARVECTRFDVDPIGLILQSNDGLDGFPSISALDFSSSPNKDCRMVNDSGDRIEFLEDLTAEQFTACLADIDDLAFSLGTKDGCLF